MGRVRSAERREASTTPSLMSLGGRAGYQGAAHVLSPAAATHDAPRRARDAVPRTPAGYSRFAPWPLPMAGSSAFARANA